MGLTGGRIVKFYRHLPSQGTVFVLFQVFMLVDFRFTNYTLLGAYVLSYLFCIAWGNVGYLVLSDAFFCLVTIWFCKVDNLSIAMDIWFWYLLFTLVPGALIVYLRNAIITRIRAR